MFRAFLSLYIISLCTHAATTTIQAYANEIIIYTHIYLNAAKVRLAKYYNKGDL